MSRKIVPTTQSFFHDGSDSPFVTVRGRCKKCNQIIDHKCPFGRQVLRRSQPQSQPQPDMDVGIETRNKGFECKICTAIVEHDC